MSATVKVSKPSPRSFLDTSVAYKLQIGTSAHRERLTASIPLDWYLNNYVQMEYYRTSLLHWVWLYFESGEDIHRTFGDALKSYAEGFGREAKSAVNAVASMELDGFSFSLSEDKEYCREKLQDFIFIMAFQFRETFTNTGKDPTRCARIPHPITLPDSPDERQEVLRNVSITYRQEEKCRSRCEINHLFEREPYKNRMERISNTSAKSAALDRIRAAISKAQQAPNAITCRSCGKMGDAIIACSLDTAWKLHTLDLVHGPISQAVGLQCEIHPSSRAVENEGKATRKGGTGDAA
jgi:hypothetical protein